jgi:hypothetical protein
MAKGYVYTEDELRQLVNQLKAPYKDDRATLQLVEKWIKSSAPTFQNYSPYFAICQRSGAGKTRLLLEIGRQRSSGSSWPRKPPTTFI